NRRQCPDGTVPQVRITPQQIQNEGGLDAYLSRIKKFPLSVPSRSQRGGLDAPAPPEPGLPKYAHTYLVGTGIKYTTREAGLSLFTPLAATNNKTAHSLMKTWTTTGGITSIQATSTTPAVQCLANCQQTVEAGWAVDPGLYGDAKPHFFVYSTPDGYWT